jgi:hypothetical protein
MDEIIGKLTAEHVRLTQIATELLAINGETLSADARPAHKLLNTLSATLQNHIAIEDKSLYPEALRHAALKELAARFLDRRKELEADYDRFKRAWPSASRIQADARAFRQQLKLQLATLAQRMFEEDEEFHPAIVKAFAAM